MTLLKFYYAEVLGYTTKGKHMTYLLLWILWSHPWDSNPRPFDYESNALSAELGWLNLFKLSNFNYLVIHFLLTKDRNLSLSSFSSTFSRFLP